MHERKPLQRVFIGIVCALGGAACVALYFFIEASHKDYSRRWVLLLFGGMLLAAGFQFLKESFKTGFSAELEELINSGARTIIYGGFGALALSGAFGSEGRIRGGFPYLPDWLNTGLGRVLFAVLGLALCALGLYCLSTTFAKLRKYLASKAT